MIFDPLYFLYLLPGLLLGAWAQFKVSSTFRKYRTVSFQNHMNGAEVAQEILNTSGIRDVKVERVAGFLSDHYDPRSKTLRLSPEVYDGRSVASAGIAAHEVGHALQHATGYAPLGIRSALVPAAQIGSNSWIWLFMGGMFLGAASPVLGKFLLFSAVILFGATVLFQLVTLPVEFDASARALVALRSGGILAPGEDKGAKKVLDAAFLTYFAGLVTAVMTLLYLLVRSGLLGGRSD